MLTTRTLLPGDLDLVCQHRVAMFTDGGRRSKSDLTVMDSNFRVWLEPRLKDGRYFGFIVEDGNIPIAGIGLMELDWPPHPSHQDDDRRGYVLNMFVDPPYRKQGIAQMLLEKADSEFEQRGIRYAILHTTSAGRSLYEQTGWEATSEMGKRIGSANGKI